VFATNLIWSGLERKPLGEGPATDAQNSGSAILGLEADHSPSYDVEIKMYEASTPRKHPDVKPRHGGCIVRGELVKFCGGREVLVF
jgi:hypothetical protein